MKNIKIPHYWSPEQAVAVFEFIDKLREQILIHHELEIIEYLKEEQGVEFKADPSIDSENEELPF